MLPVTGREERTSLSWPPALWGAPISSFAGGHEEGLLCFGNVTSSILRIDHEYLLDFQGLSGFQKPLRNATMPGVCPQSLCERCPTGSGGRWPGAKCGFQRWGEPGRGRLRHGRWPALQHCSRGGLCGAQGRGQRWPHPGHPHGISLITIAGCGPPHSICPPWSATE